MSISKGKPRMQSLLESQQRRQQVIDFLHAVGTSTSLRIAAEIGVSRREISSMLALMKKRGEIACSGPRHRALYSALATTTVSADAQYNAIRDHRDAKRLVRDAEAKQSKLRPWLTVHKCGSEPAIKSQGGQGSLRRSVFINCQQNY